MFSKNKQKASLYLGIGLIIAGILFNQPLIERLFTADAHIEKPLYINLIRGFEVMAILLGLILLIKRPTLLRIGKNELFLAIAGILMPLIMLEGGSRLWLTFLATPEQFNKYSLYTKIAPQDFQWSAHHYLNHYPTPNFKKGLTSHNSLGYRGDEFPVAKPDGVFRIVALGGSTTYSVRVEDNDKAYPAQLERIFKVEYGYDEVEVINAGVADYNSWESLLNLQLRVLDLQPDLIIIYHGTNDVHARLVQPAAYRGDDSGRRQAWQDPPISWYEKSALYRVAARKLEFDQQVVLADFVSADSYMGWPHYKGVGQDSEALLDILAQNPPIYFERNLQNMIAIAQANGSGVMLATWAHSNQLADYAATKPYETGFAESNEVVMQVAENAGIPLFDFAAEMPADKKYWADGRHVNEEGAALKASLFAQFIDDEGLIDR